MKDEKISTADHVEKAQDVISERSDRLRKLNDIRESGINPYPEKYDKTHLISDLLEAATKKSNIKSMDTIASKKPTTYLTPH